MASYYTRLSIVDSFSVFWFDVLLNSFARSA